jgi:hypothetical protein
MLSALAAITVEELAHGRDGKLDTPAVAFMAVALCGVRILVVVGSGDATTAGVSVSDALRFLAAAPSNVSQLRIEPTVKVAGRHAIATALRQYRCHGFMRRLELGHPIDVADAVALLSSTNDLARVRSLQCSGSGSSVLLDKVGSGLRRLAIPADGCDDSANIDWERLRLLRRVGPLSWLPETITAADLSGLQHLKRVDDDFGANCHGLRAVRLPPTVTSIGDRFMYHCDGLAIALDLEPLAALRSIGDDFGYNSTLPELRLPPSVTAIGEGFLYSCSRATAVLDLSRLTQLRHIDDFFAQYCAAAEVRLPPSVTSIGNYFLGNMTMMVLDLTHMTQLHTVGDHFAAGGHILDVRLPTSVTSIGENYRQRSTVASVLDLSGLSLLESIGGSFFRGTAVRDVCLPPSVTAIGPNFLSGCDSLAAALDLSHLTQLTRIDGFFADHSSLPYLRLPPSVTSIGEGFLRACKCVTAVLDLSHLAHLRSIGASFAADSSVPDVRLPSTDAIIGRGFLRNCDNISEDRKIALSVHRSS